MRVNHTNNQFFRIHDQYELSQNAQTTGKHRIWLNMFSGNSNFSQTLVGYIENATNGLDWGYDAEIFSDTSISFYSVLEDKKLTIQGRALPFNLQDTVPLGYKTTINGTMNVSLDRTDGMMNDQDICLEDKLLNIVHLLNDSNYTFTTQAGTFNDRFVLRYTPVELLDNDDYIKNDLELIVFKKQDQINIQSISENLVSVQIIDLLGREIYSENKINHTSTSFANPSNANQAVIIKVTLENGQTIKRKFLL